MDLREYPISTNTTVSFRRADGTGDAQVLLDHGVPYTQGVWSSDGEWLVLRRSGGAALGTGTGARDIVGFRPGVDSAVIELVASPEWAEQSPALSPDGRWLAYSSDVTGQHEVYVRPFPNVDSTQVRISTDGGRGPLWAHSGRELFFVDASRALVAAEIDTTSGLRVGERMALFEIPAGYLIAVNADFYDVAPGDQRFLMGSTLSSGGARFVLVLNFFEEFRQRVGN